MEDQRHNNSLTRVAFVYNGPKGMELAPNLRYKYYKQKHLWCHSIQIRLLKHLLFNSLHKHISFTISLKPTNTDHETRCAIGTFICHTSRQQK